MIRSWRLFAALLLGVVLASTFFGGINVAADTAAKQALNQWLSQIPVDIIASSHYALSSANATDMANVISGSGIEGIAHTEVISRRFWDMRINGINKTVSFMIAAIQENSRVYDGLTLTNGSSILEANETCVWAESVNARDLKIGDILRFNFSTQIYARSGESLMLNITLNLRVVGFVNLDDQALRIASGQYYYLSPLAGPSPITPGQFRPPGDNLLITEWNKTFAKLLDYAYSLAPEFSLGQDHVLVFLDRESVINPWDIASSVERVRGITSQVNNRLWKYRDAYAYNYLENILNNYNIISQTMRLQFLIVSLPVFFVAWYMGTTVSDVSYNLRRREIGLLLTKGFSRGQLMRMFLGEAALIGLIGGLIGIGLSLLLNPIFAQIMGGTFSGAPVVGTDTFFLVLTFSVGIAFLSIFQPARRASKLEAVDALQEYRYVEEVKPYRQRWPWVTLILGTYKIVTWLLGINLYTLMMRPPTYNIILMILLGVWTFFDTFFLNYVGPILFFWGFTKIFIRGSLKFQELTTRTARFVGDLGTLATRNVRRNPARAASIAFLIAMIVGYSFQVVGAYASEQDYTTRQIRFSVGADISVQLSSLVNASSTMSRIGGLPEVASATMEYTVAGTFTTFGTGTVRVADPENWLQTAHYEGELFTGNDIKTAFQQMETDNNTIILDRSVAKTLNLQVDETVAVTFEGGQIRSLKAVGFFGPEAPEAPYYGYTRSYWSYIPVGLYNHLKSKISWASGRILVKLNPGADGKAVADQIRGLHLSDVSVVYSVAEELELWQQWQQSQQGPFNPFGVASGGSMNLQRLGMAFAVVAASMGTALVTLVSLKERSREVSIMNARGLSLRQLVGMLLTENLAVVIFAVFIGAVVGLIVVQGNVSAANSMPAPFTYSPLMRHMVFPLDSILILLTCLGLIFAATIIPVIVMAKRYTSRLERMVR